MAVAMLSPGPALAAEGLNGTSMSILWALPFAAILLAIATGPLFYAHAWEHHQGKIAAACAAAVVLPLAFTAGFMPVLEAVLHTMLLEYMSFIILLFALFTIAASLSPATSMARPPPTRPFWRSACSWPVLSAPPAPRSS